MGKHEDAILRRLHEAASPLAEALSLPADVQMAAAEVEGAEDIRDALEAMALTVIALRSAEEAVKQALAQAESTLNWAFSESGVGSIKTDHFTVTQVEPKPRPMVLDPAALPAHLLKPRDPVPDMDAIKRLMREGKTVPGVEKSNTPSFIRIAARNR